MKILIKSFSYAFLTLFFSTFQVVHAQNVIINDILGTISTDDIAELTDNMEHQASFHRLHLDLPKVIEIPVRLFISKDEYRQYQKEISKSMSSSGFYSHSTRELVIYKKSKYLSKIHHTAQQFILRSDFTEAPKWLMEGLAEFYEDVYMEDDVFYTRKDGSKMHRIERWMEENTLIKASTLVNLDDSQWGKYNTRSYGFKTNTLSWALIYFLMDSEKGQEVLSNTITELQADSTKKDYSVLAEHYGGNIESLETDFLAFLKAMPDTQKLRPITPL